MNFRLFAKRWKPARPGPCWCNGPYEEEDRHHNWCRIYWAYKQDTGKNPTELFADAIMKILEDIRRREKDRQP